MIDLGDAREVASAVALHWLRNEGLAVTLELGLSDGRRLDVVGLDFYGEITGAEVKVERRDMLTDRKWVYYRRFCDRLYLVVTESLADEAECSGLATPTLGLLVVCGDGRVKLARRCRKNRVRLTDRFEVLHRLAMRAGDAGYCPNCGHRPTRLKADGRTDGGSDD